MKVLLGLSGGVDSSVAGVLLAQAGYEISAVFMQNWSDTSLPGLYEPCPQSADAAIARNIAAQQGWQFNVKNFEADYMNLVWSKLLSEYQVGRTPNPDILCNQFVKFGAFIHVMESVKADMVATGHYAQIKYAADGTAELHTTDFLGFDSSGQPKENPKDQSYFLSRIPRSVLGLLTFPLAHLEKSQVRSLAQKFGLPNAEKPDSQGICFVGKVSMADFLTQQFGEQTGNILDHEGKIIGHHQGAYRFTMGQRQGIKVAGKEPMYIAGRDLKANTITVVSGHNHPWLYRDQLTIDDLSWLTDQKLKLGDQCHIRFRHRQPLVPATIISITPDLMTIKLQQAEFAPAAGQTLALYRLGQNSAQLLGAGTLTAAVEALPSA